MEAENYTYYTDLTINEKFEDQNTNNIFIH